MVKILMWNLEASFMQLVEIMNFYERCCLQLQIPHYEVTRWISSRKTVQVDLQIACRTRPSAANLTNLYKRIRSNSAEGVYILWAVIYRACYIFLQDHIQRQSFSLSPDPQKPFSNSPLEGVSALPKPRNMLITFST